MRRAVAGGAAGGGAVTDYPRSAVPALYRTQEEGEEEAREEEAEAFFSFLVGWESFLQDNNINFATSCPKYT